MTYTASVDGFIELSQTSARQSAGHNRYYRSLIKKGTLPERSQHRSVTARFPSLIKPSKLSTHITFKHPLGFVDIIRNIECAIQAAFS